MFATFYKLDFIFVWDKHFFDVKTYSILLFMLNIYFSHQLKNKNDFPSFGSNKRLDY